jgi:hypothetical protein
VDELLAAVDVVGCASESGVGHEVDGEGGDVLWANDAVDREDSTELGAARLELVAEQGC